MVTVGHEGTWESRDPGSSFHGAGNLPCKLGRGTRSVKAEISIYLDFMGLRLDGFRILSTLGFYGSPSSANSK